MKQYSLDLTIESAFWNRGIRYVAGVDEAGRGPLAGPVVAASVIFRPDVRIDGINDSKKLSLQKRETLFDIIQRHALSVGISIVSREVIDTINIYQATLQAMTDAVAQLAPQPQHLLVDGPAYHRGNIQHTCMIDGDAQCFSIAAASIIAKVTRDRLMVELDRQYPHYGFAKHKGYGTKEHLQAIRTFGPCEIHRRSFSLPTKSESLP